VSSRDRLRYRNRVQARTVAKWRGSGPAMPRAMPRSRGVVNIPVTAAATTAAAAAV
jgi:hypothetical protein